MKTKYLLLFPATARILSCGKKKALWNKANAGIRDRCNNGNLYVHLRWQIIEQQFNPALVIASSVDTNVITKAIPNIIRLLQTTTFTLIT